MNSIYRGEPISKQDFINSLCELKVKIQEDLLLQPLMPSVVIEAAHTFSKEINQEEVVQELTAMGIPKWSAEEYIKVTINSLERKELLRKVHAELGEEPFVWRRISDDIEEKEHPLGALMHIGAGNALGLSAFSVIEGLLTGNINILKLPENEGGLSSKLLMKLIEIEPRLKPYIYVLDISSKDREVISEIMEIVHAVVVWGSDEAIRAVRELAPPATPIIEWGNRLSFAYFTKQEDEEKALHGLAMDICLTDQLYCSSPQCVFYEANNIKELDNFAERLSNHIKVAAKRYPTASRTTNIQAQITWTHELIKMEEILKEKRLITDEDKQYSVMIDYTASLKASPLFRNIWVMPIERGKLMSLLITHKGYLQTVGLSCSREEYEELCSIFYAAGVNRITACGHMSKNYSGEPHDGVHALKKYVRIINKINNINKHKS
jgi:hypothetical protein